MIIFSGWRTLVALVIAVLFASLMIKGGDVLGGVGMLAAGAGLFLYGRVINAPRKIELVTGEVVIRRGHNTLFWIPLQYWGVLMAIAGIVGLAGAK